MISKILFTSLLLFNVLFLEGQTLSYRNLTTKDGLPSNTIYQIKQDKVHRCTHCNNYDTESEKQCFFRNEFIHSRLQNMLSAVHVLRHYHNEICIFDYSSSLYISSSFWSESVSVKSIHLCD